MPSQVEVDKTSLTIQAEEAPATGQPSSSNVMEAIDIEKNQPQEPWLLPRVRICIASVLAVNLPKNILQTQSIMMMPDRTPQAYSLSLKQQSDAGASLPTVHLSERILLYRVPTVKHSSQL